MVYTIEKAKLITEQLKRFTHGYAHHVAGQFVNINYWIHEVEEAIETIDGYNKRFSNIKMEQKRWVEAHATVVYDYCPYCEGKCVLSNGKPSPPVSIAADEILQARKQLVDSIYYFLLRCYRMQLLNPAQLKVLCEKIGTGIDPADLVK